MDTVDPMLFLEECRRRGTHANNLDAAGREDVAAAVRRRQAAGRHRDLRLDAVLKAQGISPGQISVAQFTNVALGQMSTAMKVEAAGAICKAVADVALAQLSDQEFNERKGQCLTCDRGFKLRDQSVGCTVCGCAGRRKFERLRLRNPKYSCPHPGGPRFVRRP